MQPATVTERRAVVVVLDGRPVRLEERYARMVRWILALRPEMDACRTGRLELPFNGSSVGAYLGRSLAPSWLDEHAPTAGASAARRERVG